MLKSKIRYTPSKKDNSKLIFGDIVLSDSDAEFHIYDVSDEENPVRVIREFVNKRRRVYLDNLVKGVPYIIAVFGDKVAGVATTQGLDVVAPFNVHIDAPRDHSKDFMKLSIPTNVPVGEDLARAIKASLR